MVKKNKIFILISFRIIVGRLIYIIYNLFLFYLCLLFQFLNIDLYTRYALGYASNNSNRSNLMFYLGLY